MTVKASPKLIHIGLPKTATTTIQHVFRNDDRIKLIKSLYFNTPDYWTEDFNFCEEGKINVISQENLVIQSANRGKLYMTLARMARVAPDATILVTIREQRSMMLSRYKFNFPYWDGFTMSLDSWLRSGQGMDYLSLCMYGSLFKTINSFFPADQIKFMLFEDLKNDYNRFFDELYGLLGLSAPEELKENLRKNVTRSDQELLIIKKLNKYKLFKSGSALSIKEGNYISRFARKFADKKKTEKIFFWEESDYINRIEKDFRIENQLAIEQGLLKMEDLKNYGYLI